MPNTLNIFYLQPKQKADNRIGHAVSIASRNRVKVREIDRMIRQKLCTVFSRRELHRVKLKDARNKVQIDLGDDAYGIYFCQLIVDGNQLKPIKLDLCR